MTTFQAHITRRQARLLVDHVRLKAGFFQAQSRIRIQWKGGQALVSCETMAADDLKRFIPVALRRSFRQAA